MWRTAELDKGTYRQNTTKEGFCGYMWHSLLLFKLSKQNSHNQQKKMSLGEVINMWGNFIHYHRKSFVVRQKYDYIIQSENVSHSTSFMYFKLNVWLPMVAAESLFCFSYKLYLISNDQLRFLLAHTVYTDECMFQILHFKSIKDGILIQSQISFTDS